MTKFHFSTLMGLFLISACSAPPQPQPKQPEPAPQSLTPKDWKPSLDQVVGDVEDGIYSRPNQSQSALNKASQNLADLADARLFIAYTLLVQELNAQERSALFQEQQAWLSQREKLARDAVASRGGSLEAVEYASAFADITKKRLSELESRRTTERGKP